ncbi:MAG: response regulator [Anaerolineaceae bacterium]|jgi:pilus assembly protein CpaE|nr:MAG: response regulator [Anaerolineaceae bacterium]
MTHILVVDDEPINHQLVSRALEPLNCRITSAEDGTSGTTLARSMKPDLIITDVVMPDISGYEVARQLRRDAQFISTPILILTAQSGLQDKLRAFEAGADDYLSKPFEPAELAARVSALLRRAELAAPAAAASPSQLARVIAVHSLRGGTGCSTLAVNIGISLSNLWGGTILLDLTMTAGQVALMLNQNLRRTWADIARFQAGEVDMDALNSVVSVHDCGLSFIAAPTFPEEGAALRGDTLAYALSLLKERHQYIVADLPHDFGDISIAALDAADIILLVGSPDMASVRAAAAALDVYKKLGYPLEKIKPVLNATFPRSSLAKEKIETALGMNFVASIPYVPDTVLEAINLGKPLVLEKTREPISALLEDFSFFLGKPEHKKSKPENPGETWERVYKRYQDKRRQA